MATNPRPALYYTIKRDYSDMSVMRVTSLNARRVYGSVDGFSTHTVPSLIYGNFPSQEAAAVLYAVRERYREMSAPVKEAEQALRRAYDARETSIEAMLKGINANA